MSDFSDIGIEIEKHITRLGKDLQQFVEKVVPLKGDDKAFSPDCDIVESDDEYKIHIDLPGIAKKDISVTIKENVLTIKGKRENIIKESEELKRRERKSGAFSRSFALPQNVNTAEVQASFKNGVLTVAMPKSDALDESQAIPIN